MVLEVNDILRFCKGYVTRLLRATKQIYILCRYFSVPSKTLKSDLPSLFYKNFIELNNYLYTIFYKTGKYRLIRYLVNTVLGLVR